MPFDAEKLLKKKYGWETGQGLGKNNQGINQPVTASSKYSKGFGLGANSSSEKNLSLEYMPWWDSLYSKAANDLKVKKNKDGRVKDERIWKPDDSERKHAKKKKRKAMKNKDETRSTKDSSDSYLTSLSKLLNGRNNETPVIFTKSGESVKSDSFLDSLKREDVITSKPGIQLVDLEARKIIEKGKTPFLPSSDDDDSDDAAYRARRLTLFSPSSIDQTIGKKKHKKKKIIKESRKKKIPTKP